MEGSGHGATCGAFGKPLNTRCASSVRKGAGMTERVCECRTVVISFSLLFFASGDFFSSLPPVLCSPLPCTLYLFIFLSLRSIRNTKYWPVILSTCSPWPPSSFMLDPPSILLDWHHNSTENVGVKQRPDSHHPAFRTLASPPWVGSLRLLPRHPPELQKNRVL